jgi:hypothetical protein
MIRPVEQAPSSGLYSSSHNYSKPGAPSLPKGLSQLLVKFVPPLLAQSLPEHAPASSPEITYLIRATNQLTPVPIPLENRGGPRLASA